MTDVTTSDRSEADLLAEADAELARYSDQAREAQDRADELRIKVDRASSAVFFLRQRLADKARAEMLEHPPQENKAGTKGGGSTGPPFNAEY